jgi:formate hydrogenlyase subunit 3/multisubunit Na+/H+ antiporter MnhD subunit
MTGLLFASVALPALLALPIALGGRGRGVASALAPWSPIPALLLALVPGGIDTGALPWPIEGSLLGLDLTGQLFLLFTALLWTVAGVFARRYLADDPARPRFLLFHLLTLTGNLGLVVAQDAVTFYLFFALMTFAGYGLVVHAKTGEAFRAGRIYLALAVLGEALLLTGLLSAVHGAESLALEHVAAAIAGSPQRNLILALLLAGFGIKAGAIPLHVWLPLAHPVAPTPASAVLSGSMIKAGLLGWLRFLPLGLVALPGWGALLVVMGLAAAFFGVAVGVTQRDPKTTLAYSSISQMGIINVGVGLGLMAPEHWPLALGACLVYALHHGLAKGALFLGEGVARSGGGAGARRLVFLGLALTALAVAGAPLTSGAVAKEYLKDAAGLSPGAWPGALDWLLPLTAIGTTLLMARFLVLVAPAAVATDPRHPGMLPPGLWVPWVALLLVIAGVVRALPLHYELGVTPPGAPYPGALWIATWPILAGLLIVWTVRFADRRWGGLARRFQVAPGDLLLLFERFLRWVRRPLSGRPVEPPAPAVTLGSRWYGIYATSGRRDRLIRLEIALTSWGTAALLTALVVGIVFVLGVLGEGIGR